MESIPIAPKGRDLPSFSLGQEELPEVRTWEVGSQHYLVVKVEMTEKANTKNYGMNDSEDRGKLMGRFKFLGVKPLGDKPVDSASLERADFEGVVARARSGA